MKLQIISVFLSLLFSTNGFSQIEEAPLPGPGAKVLFAKRFPNVVSLFSFDGDSLTLNDKKQIFKVNINTGVQKRLKHDNLQIEEFYPAQNTPDGAYVVSLKHSSKNDGEVYRLSEMNPPKFVWKATSNIRWMTNKDGYSVMLLKSGDVALLADGKVTLLDKGELTNAKAVHNGIEVTNTTSKGSWVRRYNRSGRIASCEMPGIELYLNTLSEDGSMAFGLAKRRRNSQLLDIVGYDCKAKIKVWQKSLFNDVFLHNQPWAAEIKKQSHHWSVNEKTFPFSCGNSYCASLAFQHHMPDGQFATGIYCVDQKTGANTWTGSWMFDDRTTNKVDPAICHRDRMIAFSNFGQLIFTQKFPVTVEKAPSFLDAAGQEVAYSTLAGRNYLFTNDVVLPIIAKGKIALTTSNETLLVIGK